MLEALLQEFIVVYQDSKPVLHPDTDGIIVLTADGHPFKAGEQNRSRIRYGLSLYNQLRHLAGRPIPFVFSGVTEEQEVARRIIDSLAPSYVEICFQDCGNRGVANTRTQFETMATDPRTSHMQHPALVTNRYHIPRVARTAGKYLSPQCHFSVYGEPNDEWIGSSFLLVMGEIERIKKYSEKGDILESRRDRYR